MTRKKPQTTPPPSRSSAAEYLTFVAATGSDKQSVEMRYEDENIWLSQKMMATLHDVTVPAINQHLKRIFADQELAAEQVIKPYLTTAADGKTYKVKHYNLQAIVAVGFKIENERAVQFRKWAAQVVKNYTIQGWVMDVDRLKSGGSVLTQEFFDRQLEKVREIRLSERKFYQKITDIYATSLDYDATAASTQRFFAAVQNKLHYAVHGQTAAEVLVDRADASRPRMGLTSWEGAPLGGGHRYDVVVAKNYLSPPEMDQMQRIVSAYLDMAEMQATRRVPMTMADWETRRRQGHCRAGERARTERIRKVPYRAGSPVRERLRPSPGCHKSHLRNNPGTDVARDEESQTEKSKSEEAQKAMSNCFTGLELADGATVPHRNGSNSSAIRWPMAFRSRLATPPPHATGARAAYWRRDDLSFG